MSHATPAAPAAPARDADDFPSWMNPMLVKELRQGVQSGAFAWTFILLHAGMFVLMTLWVLTFVADRDSPTDVHGFYRGIFWALFGVAAMLVVPGRAAGSMAAERQGTALDLLRLTRLSSTQIVLGKWLGTMAQVGLVTVSVLPYVVLQYFFGGLDVIADLMALAGVLMAASVTTAGSVAMAKQSSILRGGLFLILGYAAVGFAVGTAGGFSLTLTPSGTLVGVAAVAAALLTAVLLEYSAAAVAPAAENHAGRIRLLVLVAVALALGVGPALGPGIDSLLATAAATLVVVVATVEFTTNASPVIALHAPFARARLPGHLAAALFTPGWATAVPFLLVATAPWLLLGSATGRLGETAVGLAALLLPLPLLALFPAGRQRWAAILLVHAASIALYALGGAWLAMNSLSRRFPVLLPLPAFIARYGAGMGADEVSAIPALCTTAVCLVPLVPLWLYEMRALSGRLAAASGRRDASLPPRAAP